jgi:hypothetical protein
MKYDKDNKLYCNIYSAEIKFRQIKIENKRTRATRLLTTLNMKEMVLDKIAIINIIVRFEVLAAVAIRFLSSMACSPLKVSACSACHLLSRCYLVLLTLRP